MLHIRRYICIFFACKIKRKINNTLAAAKSTNTFNTYKYCQPYNNDNSNIFFFFKKKKEEKKENTLTIQPSFVSELSMDSHQNTHVYVIKYGGKSMQAILFAYVCDILIYERRIWYDCKEKIFFSVICCCSSFNIFWIKCLHRSFRSIAIQIIFTIELCYETRFHSKFDIILISLL